MKLSTKEQLRAAAVCKTMDLELPELDGLVVKVRGFSVDDIIKVRGAATFRHGDGSEYTDAQNDIVWSVCTAIVDPVLDPLADGPMILAMPQGVVTRIIRVANELSGNTEASYEALRTYLQANPYVQKLYYYAAKYLHRLPSELTNVSVQEFNGLLASIEIEHEVAEAETEE